MLTDFHDHLLDLLPNCGTHEEWLPSGHECDGASKGPHINRSIRKSRTNHDVVAVLNTAQTNESHAAVIITIIPFFTSFIRKTPNIRKTDTIRNIYTRNN